MLYLCILDGFGIGKDKKSDAIQAAIADGKAPFFKELFEKHPYAKLECSGEAVGLPPGTMGNSEVNHLNMGAGRVVYQSLLRVNKAIEDGSFYNNEALLKAVNNCKQNNSTLHLMGVLQGGGGCVHGNIEHLFGLLELVKRNNLEKVVLHPCKTIKINWKTLKRDSPFLPFRKLLTNKNNSGIFPRITIGIWG